MNSSKTSSQLPIWARTVIGASLLLWMAACSWIGPERTWDNPYDVPDVIIEKCTPSIDSIAGLKQLNIAQEMVTTAFATCNNSAITRSVWSYDGGTRWDTTSGLVGKHRWSINDTGSNEIRVVVISDAGEKSTPFTFSVSVNSSRPYIVTTIADTLVSQRASITRALLAADLDGSIVRYYWSTRDTGWSDSANTSTSAVVALSEPLGGTVKVRWSAVDNDGLTIMDTFRVTFNRGPMSVTVTRPAVTQDAPFDTYDIAANSGRLTMRYYATDPDAMDKISYTVAVRTGAGDTLAFYNGADSSVILNDLAASTLLKWDICAKDAFGDSVRAQGSFTTARAPSSPEGMVLVPGGISHVCNMGQSGFDSSEQPIHPVHFSRSFLMDSTEVTCAEYFSVTGKGDSALSVARLPMVNVTWFDALLYCNARSKAKGFDTVYSYASCKTDSSGKCIQLENIATNYSVKGYRLPTEAEWEYACKRDSMTLFFWGNGTALAQSYSWTRENSNTTLHPVATLLASVSGLYDMSGNAWEWCNDWFDPVYYTTSPQLDPAGPVTGIQKVIRGGSYRHSAHFAQAGTRSQLGPVEFNHYTGFRTILPVE